MSTLKRKRKFITKKKTQHGKGLDRKELEKRKEYGRRGREKGETERDKRDIKREIERARERERSVHRLALLSVLIFQNKKNRL